MFVYVMCSSYLCNGFFTAQSHKMDRKSTATGITTTGTALAIYYINQIPANFIDAMHSN